MLVIAAAAAFAGLVAFATGWLAPLDRALFDAQTRMQQRLIDTDAALVEIDAQSLSELGTWPWPRSWHAEVIDALTAAGAARIVIDIDFSSTSTPEADARLADAVRRSGRVVLPQFWQRTSVTASSNMLFQPIPEIREHATLGSVNLSQAEDGPVRELADLTPDAFSGWTPPLAQVLTGHMRPQAQPLLIDYRIAPASFPTLSYARVLQDPAAAATLRGRTVFVGATAIEMGDVVTVPVHGTLPGVMVQMLAYETLRAHPLHRVPMAPGLLVVLLVAAGAAVAAGRLRWTLLAGFAVAGALLLAATAALLHGVFDLWWQPLPAIVTVMVAAIGTLLHRMHGESLRALHYWVRYRRQDALLREVVTQSNEAILTLDDAGRILTANPRAETLLGAPAHVLTGAPVQAFVPEAQDLVVPAGAEPARREIELARPGRDAAVLEVSGASIVVEDQRIVTLRLRDITLQKNRERELHYHATHDALTGLPNRLALSERLDAAFGSATAPKRGALLLMDLDGFKEVNDTLGHSVGDLVLREIAGRFTSLVPGNAFIARLGGDEFALLLDRAEAAGDVQWVCRAFLASASEPVPVRGVPVSLGVSGGLALWPEHAADGESLLQKADLALYAAKSRHTVLEVFDPGTEINSPRRLEMLTLLRQAVREDELSLVYQPKVHLGSGRVTGVEALSRWHSPQLGQVSPADFMPLAEATEIITPLTRWTLERGLEDCARWRAAGTPVGVAINLSARHLQSSQLVDDVAQLLQSAGLPAMLLELEITESAIMSDPQRAFAILTELRELGVQLSIDDFGTGYSSLAYLQRLQVDRLKIDRSFVENLAIDHGSRAIVSSTIQLAHALDLEVVAEGIETRAQHDILVDLGCDYGQGYLYARGMRAAEVGPWLRARVDEELPLRRAPDAGDAPLRRARA